MSYTRALMSLRPGVANWRIADDSTAELLLETITGWPQDNPLPTAAELEVAIVSSRKVDQINSVWNTFRALRAQFFTRLDYMRLDALTAGDTATALTIQTAIVALRNMPTSVDLTACADRAAMEKAVLTAWQTAIVSMPADLRSKFTAAGGA